LRYARDLPAGILLVLAGAGCGPDDLPDPESAQYRDAAAALWRGVAAVQVGETRLAEASFARVTELAPGEPAGWADLAVVALQRGELDEAAGSAERALALAPDDGRILLLAAVVERERGNVDTATAYLRRAATAEQGDLRAPFLLAQVLGEEDAAERVIEAGQLMDRVLAVAPGNLVALVERARLAARQRDATALRQTLDRIQAQADSLSVPISDDVRAVWVEAESGAFDRAASQIGFVEAALQPLAAYQDAAAAVRSSPSRMDLLCDRFIRLPAPTARAAPPDTALGFAAESLTVGVKPIAWVRAVWMSEEPPLALLAGGPVTVWVSPEPGVVEPLPFPSGPGGPPPSPATVAAFDYDYDFRIDLALAGGGGLRLLRQAENGSFDDVTLAAIPPAAARGSYAGAWAADLDLEGDLDLVLARTDGEANALRNRGDGSFEAYSGFPGVTGLRDFAWADLDADGDPDMALLDAAGVPHVFLNRRSETPQFVSSPLAASFGAVDAMAVADLDRDATLDLVLLGEAGVIIRLGMGGLGWEADTVTRWPGYPGDGSGLMVADLDNNGELDLVAAAAVGSQVWLATPAGFEALPPLDIRVSTVADIDGDGRLDLAGTSSDGEPLLLVGQGAAHYYSTTIRPRAAEATGDRRINPFGIGGEIEVRAGLVYQKQVIREAAVHFGLGDNPQVDVARIIWPNGSVQAEFNLAATNETILAIQRLKGSCPWVFTFDGEGMQFVTDFLWRTALGLRINAQGDAAVIHSEDWIRIRGDQLVARDGFYDVRITADLWETHFFDHVGLMVVDHPENTEVFVDERFMLPAPTPAVYVTETPRSVAWARDQAGRDVTDVVRVRDERFVDTFERGPYQGVATDHFLEIALREEAPRTGPLWLVAFGWVYPTDASINVAISQGANQPPSALRLEVPDGSGGWVTADSSLGFPAGKTKTMLIDLQHAFRPGTERRLRLRTNMEIYWDQITWTVRLPDAAVTTQRLLPATADLRYRGFSRVSQAGRTAPELPDYRQIAAGVPLWRDLVGFYTRFGDVRPLTEAVDDRYVIMNAGDELVFRFRAPAPPAAGWRRDFVLIGDGWVKDGDYNTGYSTTVTPLPYHGLTDYARPPTRLSDDPGYRRHPEDWRTFHTRYVTPREFDRALIVDDRR